MEKLYKNVYKGFKLIAIIMVVIVLGRIIVKTEKIDFSNLSSSINNLSAEVGSYNNPTNMATNTVPAVTNGGSSSSGGGNTIKSIQYIDVPYKESSISKGEATIFNISTINSSKTEVITPNDMYLSYSLSNTQFTVYSNYNYSWSSNTITNSKTYYYSNYYEKDGMVKNITVKLIEYY